MLNEKNVLWQHLKKTTEIVLVEDGVVKYGDIIRDSENNAIGFKPEKINTKIGIAVAVKDNDGKVTVGWSKRHDGKETGKFNSSLGYMIARERALKGHGKKMPRRFVPYIMRFANRAARYFKVERKDVFITGIDI